MMIMGYGSSFERFEDIDGNRLNPIIRVTPHGRVRHGDKEILFLGGWEQNWERMARFAHEFPQLDGWSVTGFSAFDVINPKLDISTNDVANELDWMNTFLDTLPPRMIERARVVYHLLERLPQITGADVPRHIVTHCVGANVALLAVHLAYCIAKPHPLKETESLVLAEPMIAEELEVMDYAKAFAKHERAAKSDSSLISLQELAHPGMPNLGNDRRLPLGDIACSKGVVALMRCCAVKHVRTYYSVKKTSQPQLI